MIQKSERQHIMRAIELARACLAFPDSALLVAGQCSFTRSKLRLPSSLRLDLDLFQQNLANGNMTEAAKRLQVERQTIYKWIKAYEIEK